MIANIVHSLSSNRDEILELPSLRSRYFPNWLPILLRLCFYPVLAGLLVSRGNMIANIIVDYFSNRDQILDHFLFSSKSDFSRSATYFTRIHACTVTSHYCLSSVDGQSNRSLRLIRIQQWLQVPTYTIHG